ncbi:DEAD/DEAH box helicase family protein [Candidatus Berkiella aquae]|uniref:DEAD/DEAH box helicase family protein n=1 Tax=Candidatus Berkiella aquae TaxID=295108 RepID=A0A0Q9YXT8_9GAMM|nr:DEAD/DEAH box helicase family protein [Candidatus Berkiella aquae]MCS5711489.1 DEAD/DEAH box helicase family protein [Candidatus Berkiella aquae]
MPRKHPKRTQYTKPPLKVRKALHKGELLSGVTIQGNKVALKLKPKFNHPENFPSINKGFFDLYLRSEDFRRKFERPMRGNVLYVLILKEGHGYTHSQEILAALQAFATPTPRRDIKKDLSTGALLADVILEGNRVTLVMHPNYAHSDNYLLINKLFYRMHCGIPNFAAKFELPTQRAKPPVLTLKEGHGYQDKTAILAALKEFADVAMVPVMPPVASSSNVQEVLEESAVFQIENQFVEAFKTGSLFTMFTDHIGLYLAPHISLHLAPYYNQPFYYQSIERMLNELCRNSQALSAQVEDIKTVEGIVQLRLRPQNIYPSAAAVLAVLMNQANNIYPQSESFLPEKSAMPEYGNELGEAHFAPLTLHIDAEEETYNIYSQRDRFLPEKTAIPEYGNELGEAHFASLTLHIDAEEETYNIYSQRDRFLPEEAMLEYGNELGEAHFAPLTLNIDAEEESNNIYFQHERLLPEKAAILESGIELAGAFMAPFTSDMVAEEETNLTDKDGLLSSPKNDASVPKRKASNSHKRPSSKKAKSIKPNEQSASTTLESNVKPKPTLKIREALYQGELLASITLDGNQVHLKLTSTYDKLENYASISKAFYDLYPRSTAFRAKFEKPTRCKNAVVSLTLKNDHGYQDEQEIMQALRDFAVPPERIEYKEKLRQGELFVGAVLNGNQVLLTLHEQYNNLDNYRLIRKMLYKLHCDSVAFSEKFELPTQSDEMPALTLKDNHDYEDPQAILEALKSFAALTKSLEVQKILAQGKLLVGVTLNGNSVELKLHENYNKPENYRSINQSFYQLYIKASHKGAEFQVKFEKPVVNYEPPSLTLKPNHGYKNEAEIFAALKELVKSPLDTDEVVSSNEEISQIASDESPKRTDPHPQKVRRVKKIPQKAMVEGRLLAGVILQDNEAILQLQKEYNQPQYYNSIKYFLCNLYRKSIEFQSKFKRPKCHGSKVNNLVLKDNHGFTDGTAVLKALRSYASAKPTTKIKEVLHQEELLASQSQNEFNFEQHRTEEISRTKGLTSVVKKNSPNGHIAEKYLGGVLPQLPEPIYGQITERLYNHHLTLIELSSPRFHRTNRQRQSFAINCPEINAIFYSHQSLPGSHEQVAFIFAGRKEKALLPEVYTARCILVLTQQEYSSLKDLVPDDMDVLVLVRINSNTHGEYADLSKLTARRIGIFLMAHHWNLNHFVMLDDNIKGINYQIDDDAISTIPNHFEKFYTLLLSQLKNQGCVSIATESNRISAQGQLGSKCFLINMQLIRQQLTSLESVFLLQPPAHEVHKSCEDYYFQILLHVMLERGYQVISRDIATLQRSHKEQNSCVNAQIRAEIFTGPRFPLPPQQQSWLEQTLKMLNQLIEKNINDYQEKQAQIMTIDIGPTHIRAHEESAHQFSDSGTSSFSPPLVLKKKQPKSATSNASRSITPQVTAAATSLPLLCSEGTETRFIDRFQTLLSTWQDNDGLLYDYQVKAIKAVGQQNSPFSCLEIPTGCGKSIIQYRLASLAFSLLDREELVMVVSPQIQLTRQLYESFLEGYKIFNETQFDNTRIITVSSDNQSCSLRLLAENKKFHKEKHIVIICLESFERFHQLFPEQMRQRVRLVLLDECHDYPNAVEKLPTLGLQDTLVVGCSATLLSNTALGKPIFTYPIAQAIQEGRLAPVIVDSLGVNYSKENVKKLIQCLPLILQHQPHPGFKETETLASTKTMVFLPKRSDCNKAYDVLSKANIPCFIIHSENEECKADLKRFVQQTRYGVVLCVRMLFLGFNDLNIGTVIIAQNKTKAKKQKHVNAIKQMFGRAIRKNNDKIAYVLTFENTKKKIIDPILAEVAHTYPASSDYLAANNAYRFDRETQTWKVDDADEVQDVSQIVFRIEASNDYEKRRLEHNTLECDASDSDVESETSDSNDEFISFSQPLIFSQQFMGFVPQKRATALSEEPVIEALNDPISSKVRVTR